MGRLLFFLALLGAGWMLVNRVEVAAWITSEPVGTRTEGRRVVRDTGQVEAEFTRLGPVSDSFMLFGGIAGKGITHASVGGLALRHARLIAARAPDFHLCASPGARQAQSLTEDLSFVAENRSARRALAEAVRLHKERVGSNGPRTCITVEGAELAFDRVRWKHDGSDFSHEVAPVMARSRLVLAETAEVVDCEALLR